MKSSIHSKFLAIVLGVALLLSLAACGSSQAKTIESLSTASVQTTPKPIDPLGKYEPAITVTAVRSANSEAKYIEGESIDKNLWYEKYERDLGIKLVNKWSANEEQYADKLNVSIASGDLPDFIELSSSQTGVSYKILEMLTKSGSIKDMSDTYEMYASPLVKGYMSESETLFNTGKINGKLMGIVNNSFSPMDVVGLAYVREDWRKKLNLNEPKTFQDLLKISEAFTTMDPDGNNKNDTFGLGATKDAFGGRHGTLQGVANAFHAYTGAWIKNESGNLSYGSISPAMKPALEVLQKLYANGQLDKEFAVKDRAKLFESIVSDKCGLLYAGMAYPLMAAQELKNKNPNSEWKIYPLLSADNKPVAPLVSLPSVTIYAVNKNSKYPEALVKMLNYYAECDKDSFTEGTKGSEYRLERDKRYSAALGDDAYNAWVYAFAHITVPNANLNSYLDVSKALKANSESSLDPNNKFYYDTILEYKKGNNTKWGYSMVFGENSSYKVINDEYVVKKNTVYNEFYGSPTATMSSKWASLKKIEDETFLQIIMGEKPVAYFDEFVKDWKSLGGDTITKEINEWYKAKQ